MQEVGLGNKLEIDMEVEFILFYCQLTTKPHNNYSINRKSIKWKLIYIHFASFWFLFVAIYLDTERQTDRQTDDIIYFTFMLTI